MDEKHKALLSLKKQFNITKDKDLLYKMEEILNDYPVYQSIFIETQRLFVFRQFGKIDEGLKYGRECLNKLDPKELKNSKSSKWFFNEYCWLIYFFIKNNKPTLEQMREGFGRILKFCGDNVLLVSRSAILIFKKIKEFNNKNKIVQAGFLFSEKLNNLYLSNEENELKLKLLKAISDYYKSKRDWLSVRKWILTQNNNILDVFLKRDLAFAYANSGSIDKALNIFFNEILIEKKDWYIFSDIGRLYLKKGDYDNAENYLLISILLSKDKYYTVGVIEDYGRLLEEKNKLEQAMCYFKLVADMRIEKNWKVSESLKRKSGLCEQAPLFGDLKKEWVKLLFKKGFLKKGRIIKIFPNNKAGFLDIERGSVFFINSLKLRLALEKECFYFFVPSFDKKKKRITQAALLLSC